MKTKSDYYWELKQGIDILHAKLRIVIGVRHTMTIHDAAVAILRHTMTHGQGDGEITGGGVRRRVLACSRAGAVIATAARAFLRRGATASTDRQGGRPGESGG